MKNILDHRKAQMVGQIFIFVLAAVIFILILFYGYKAISDFTGRSEQISMIEVQTELESAVKAISLDYKSVRKKELIIPNKFREICFVDPLKIRALGPLNTDLDETHPIIYDAVKDGSPQNVYFVPMADTPLEVGNIYMGEQGYACIESSSGRITLRLEGLGDKTGISEWAQ